MVMIIIKSIVSGVGSYFLTPFIIQIGKTEVAGIYRVIGYVLAFLFCYLVLSGVVSGLERGGIMLALVFFVLLFAVGGAFALVTFAFFIGVSIGETLGNGLPWDSLIGVPLTAVILLWNPIKDIKNFISEHS